MALRQLLIRGGCVVTLDEGLGDFASADVLVEGGSIVDVAPSIAAGAGAAVFVRLAAEELVVAGLAAAGEVVHDLRDATRLAERLARERARVPSALRDVPGLLLGDGGAAHRDAVVRHAAELRSHVLSAPGVEPAARLLRQADVGC